MCVCVCVCVGFVIYMCVCVCVCVCVGFVMRGCFRNVYTSIFLSCKANATVKLTKTGHGLHFPKLVVICVVLCIVCV